MAADSSVPPRRAHFATADLGAGPRLPRPRLRGRRRLGRFGDARPLVSHDQVDAGSFTVASTRLSADPTFEVTGQDDVLVVTLLAGRAGHDGRSVDRFGTGDAFVDNHPHADLMAQTHDAHLHAVALPAACSPSPCPQPRPCCSARPPGCSPPPALTIFPNRLVFVPTPADRADGRPTTLRRAIAFIEDNPDLDISITDIACATHVTRRAVQLAFRRHPGDGVTVTAVAARWGFTPSRSTEHYRAAYGVLPSATLRS